jgi:hypothetical protein
MNKWQRRRLKEQKRADRRRRSMIRKVKKMKKRLGVEDLHFYFSHFGPFYCSSEEGIGSEILNPEKFKECVQSNTLALTNIDTKQEYSNFTELLKERLIIKIAGL